jgi:aspartyl-tRNA synthetase
MPAMDTQPFPELKYREAMLRYGSDKPDRRYGMPIINVSSALGACGFPSFDEVMRHSGGGVFAVAIPQLGGLLSRKETATMLESFQTKLSPNAKHLLPCKVEADGSWKSQLSKHVSPAVVSAVNAAVNANPGDLIVFCAGTGMAPCVSLGALRPVARDTCDAKKVRMTAEPHLLSQWNAPAGTHWKQLNDVFWVTDFPMFEPSESGLGYQSCHHPFTAPIAAHAPLLAEAVSAITANAPMTDVQSKLLAITAQHYDLVYNGVEVAGGSIR